MSKALRGHIIPGRTIKEAAGMAFKKVEPAVTRNLAALGTPEQARGYAGPTAGTKLG